MGNNLSVTIQEGSAKELVELYNRLALEFETSARKVFPNVHWYCHPTTVKQVEDSRYHWACSRQMQVTLYVNDSADSDEGIKLLKEAGIEFRRVPANDHTMPQLVVGSMEFQGLNQIRWYLYALQAGEGGE